MITLVVVVDNEPAKHLSRQQLSMVDWEKSHRALTFPVELFAIGEFEGREKHYHQFFFFF